MYKLWNNLKTTILLAALMGLCLGVGYWIGGPRALIPALIIGGVLNVLAYFFSDKIALATMRAQEIGREDDPALWDIVEDLARRGDMPMPRVYVSPAQAPNAFATGRNPAHSAVCVTAGLRQVLTDDELAGVMAHELSHVRHRDILISTIAAVMAGAISVLAYMLLFFGGGRNRNPLGALLLFILAPIAATIIQLAISRSREFEADRGAAELAGSPRGLANALRKLDAHSRRIPLPVPDSQANMFIVAPFTGRKAARLFMTHPPIDERIERLMEMESYGRTY